MSESSQGITRGIAPGASLIERFSNQAMATPEALAIRAGDVSLCYAELAQRVEGIAAALEERGFEPGQRVAFSVTRDARSLAFLLGILRAGGAYIPLDARLPRARLEMMVEDIRPDLSLVDEAFASDIKIPGRVDAHTLWLESETAGAPSKALADLPFGEASAYILFTSGSTGRPKGTLISHRALDAFLTSINESLALGPGEITLAGTPLSFDISIVELFLPIITGGSILLSRNVDEPSEICTLCATHPIRLMWTTPSKWRALLRAGLRPSPQMTAVSGGEALPQPLLEQLLPHVGSLWNSYGPTEATCAVTMEQIESTTSAITIGRAIPGVQITIVDEDQNPLAPGETGELLIAGPTVGSGYWERPELTQRVFLRDPADALAPTHYRSGDLGQEREDGRIVFLGRVDRQVKVRGHRVELGEIEAAALTHPEVPEAVADLRELKPGDARLILYYTTTGDRSLDQRTLRGHLSERVPGHSVPQHFIWVEAFPLSPTGKIDIKALPDPSTDRSENTRLISPRTPFENRLHRLFMEELGHRQISTRDSFFDLGGHSIMAASIFAQMHTDTGIDLPLARLVEAPTIEGLARIFEEHAEAQSNQPDWSGLVRFREHVSPRAVFFIHAAGGNVLNYAPIAAQIEEASVYGIQARGLDGLTPPPKTISEIVENYANLIRGELDALHLDSAVICGGSFGGCVAVEVARRLRSEGIAIPLVILLDAFGPVPREVSADEVSAHRPSLKGVFARTRKLGRSFLAAYYRFRGHPLPNPIRYTYLTDRHVQALQDFRVSPEAKRTYDGPVLLLRGPLTLQSRDRIYGDPDLGWGGVLTGPVNHATIEATHDVFVEHPDTVHAVCNALRDLETPESASSSAGPS